MSSKFYCALPQSDGLIMAGEILPTCRFLRTNATVPTWWTQHSALTGWFVRPQVNTVARLTASELVEWVGLPRPDFWSISGPHQGESRRLTSDQLGQRPIRARRLFLRHTQNTRSAIGSGETGGGAIFFSGEALYADQDMGAVEAGASQWTGDSADDHGRLTINGWRDTGVSLDERMDEPHRSAMSTGPDAVLLRRLPAAQS